MKLRAATAGFFVLKWSVNCLPVHSQRGDVFRLWPEQPLSIYDVKNAVLVPGYRSPDKNKEGP